MQQVVRIMMEEILVKDIIKMNLFDLIAFTHLQKRIRRLAKMPIQFMDRLRNLT